jgi:hypothetical protein
MSTDQLLFVVMVLSWPNVLLLGYGLGLWRAKR